MKLIIYQLKRIKLFFLANQTLDNGYNASFRFSWTFHNSWIYNFLPNDNSICSLQVLSIF